MSEPITITATVACWLCPDAYKPHELTQTLQSGSAVQVVNMVSFYGAADRKEFAGYIRVGEADVTLRLLPQDEQTRLAVQSLQAELEKVRAAWLKRQQEILADIAKLQALTYEAADRAEAAA